MCECECVCVCVFKGERERNEIFGMEKNIDWTALLFFEDGLKNVFFFRLKNKLEC